MSTATITPTGNGSGRSKPKRRVTPALFMRRRARRAPEHELPALDVFDHLEREPDRICQLPPGIK